MRRTFLFAALLTLAFTLTASAQEPPYFVTYDSHLEEPGNLEISLQPTIGLQKQQLPTFVAPLLELEYGWSGWWTSELYLEGAGQVGDTAVFSGWRLENRFRPLRGEHPINPILYFEFEDTNEASRIRKEIVGHSEQTDESLAALRLEKSRELEGKLILSSNVHGWNISENFIVEKNTTEAEAVEFGYALGVAHPLATVASGKICSFCRENFIAGLELYGGLGTTDEFGTAHTAQYIAPALVWQINASHSIKASTAFGLTPGSDRLLVRIGYTYEIAGFGTKVKNMFKGKQ
jgi:hypothetical protein